MVKRLMRTVRIFILLAGLASATTLPSVQAQQPNAATETPPAPTPVPSAENNYGYPDIESLREPGSSKKLFPDQPPAAPDPTQPQARGAGRRGGNGGGGGLPGRPRRSGRRGDALTEQAATDPLTLKVVYRRAKTLVMARDPDLAELLHRADRAGTDPEKRAFLKQYYVRLYDEVAKVDPSPEMKKHLDTLRLIARTRYEPKRREVGGEEDLVLGHGGRRGGGRRR